MELSAFLYMTKQQLLYVNRVLQVYYSSKFINRDMLSSLALPSLDSNSYILNEDLLALFCLSNDYFQKAEKLSLLYSMSTHGSSFNRLTYAIKGYEGPTLILIKHVEKGENQTVGNSTPPPQIFGGFASAKWEEQLQYHGQSDCFVFSLAPKFKTYAGYQGSGGQSYMYLNSRRIAHSKFKVGLGFGGTKFEGFRVWIDEDMEKGTASFPNDDTYAKGYLVEPFIQKFNVSIALNREI